MVVDEAPCSSGLRCWQQGCVRRLKAVQGVCRLSPGSRILGRPGRPALRVAHARAQTTFGWGRPPKSVRFDRVSQCADAPDAADQLHRGAATSAIRRRCGRAASAAATQRH